MLHFVCLQDSVPCWYLWSSDVDCTGRQPGLFGGKCCVCAILGHAFISFVNRLPVDLIPDLVGMHTWGRNEKCITLA